MNLLLDTHTFIWWTSNPDKLSQTATDAIVDPANLIVLSLASIWEMLVKEQIDKLQLPSTVRDLVNSEISANHMSLLPIRIDHLWRFGTLPMHHKDPFDRILIAQCLAEGLTCVTVDPMLPRYGVSVLW